VFYNAMIIFAQKHFSKKNARLFAYLIRMAIYFRASMAIVSRFFKKVSIPLTDTLLIYSGLFGLKYIWEKFMLLSTGNYYPTEFLSIAIPSYIAIWLISILFAGGYDQPVKLKKLLNGILWGTGFILIGYALLPESARFSRALILLGALWTTISLPGYRYLMDRLKIGSFQLDKNKTKRFAIIGSLDECKKSAEFIKKSNIIADEIFFVSTENNKQAEFTGNFSQLNDIINIHKIDEIIFCAKDLSPADIIETMSLHHHKNLDFKIAPPESSYIIGSNSIHTSGDLYIIDTNAISKASNLRNKRSFDIAASILSLLASPLYFTKEKNTLQFYRNIFHVLSNNKSWVGFDPAYIQSRNSSEAASISNIKEGILYPSHLFNHSLMQEDTKKRLNVQYAKDYHISNDIRIWIRNINKLDRIA